MFNEIYSPDIVLILTFLRFYLSSLGAYELNRIYFRENRLIKMVLDVLVHSAYLLTFIALVTVDIPKLL